MTKFATLTAFTLGLVLAQPLVAHPHDVTSTTQYGLVQRDFAKVDIATMTPEEATAIWKEKVWDVLRCEELPDPVAAILFHIGATQGVTPAALILETAARQNGSKAASIPGTLVSDKLVSALAKSKKIDAITLDMIGLAIRRLAFTAGAATQMADWSKQIVMLDRFTRDVERAEPDEPDAPPAKDTEGGTDASKSA